MSAKPMIEQQAARFASCLPLTPEALLVSAVCLCVGHAVLRGIGAGDIDISAAVRAVTGVTTVNCARVVAAVYDDLHVATREQLDCAIAMYTAHLQLGGYRIEIGGLH